MNSQFPLQFHLADGSVAMMKTVVVQAGLCRQLAWALKAMGKPSGASDELVAALDEAPSWVHGGWSFLYDDGAPSSLSGRLAHNWLMATGRGSYKDACEELRAAARIRFGGQASHGSLDHWEARELERKAQALGLPEAAPEELKWSAHEDAQSARLSAQVPSAKAPSAQRALSVSPQDAKDIDQTVAWLARVSSLWGPASAQWKAAGLAFERDPCLAATQALGQGAWGEAEPAVGALGGELWVAVGEESSGALTFISPNGSSMAELARGKTFGSSEEALSWAKRNRGVGAIKLAWSLEGFEPASPRQKAPALVAKALAEREKMSLEGAASGAEEPKAAPKPAKRPGL